MSGKYELVQQYSEVACKHGLHVQSKTGIGGIPPLLAKNVNNCQVRSIVRHSVFSDARQKQKKNAKIYVSSRPGDGHQRAKQDHSLPRNTINTNTRETNRRQTRRTPPDKPPKPGGTRDALSLPRSHHTLQTLLPSAAPVQTSRMPLASSTRTSSDKRSLQK